MASPAPADFVRREEFAPPSLEGQPNATIVILDVPTPAERDRIGTRLFELGIIAITRDKIRAVLIDELYVLHSEIEADELASFLDTYWLRMSSFEAARQDWITAEGHRLLEVAIGATDRPSAPMPKSPVKPRDEARATLIVNEITDRSPRLRSLFAAQLDYEQRIEAMTARLAIKGVMPGDGAAAPFPLELEGDHEKLSESSLDRIREHIGERAWRELTDRIALLFTPPTEAPETLGGAAPDRPSGASGEIVATKDDEAAKQRVSEPTNPDAAALH
jgi:hypothetical protein